MICMANSKNRVFAQKHGITRKYNLLRKRAFILYR